MADQRRNNITHGERRSSYHGAQPGTQGANASLLMSMMSCVDTTLFSPQQIQNWEHMRMRIKEAADQNLELVVPVTVADLTNNERSSTTTTSTIASSNDPDNRQSLHREASIQDVLSCLLDQSPPSARVLHSNGSSVLLHSELKQRNTSDETVRPTLKSLLSSNDFSIDEKKESLKHLLSFIDHSFPSQPEPLTDVYKEKSGHMKRLSSLQLMRSFMTPNPTTQAMGRTTSFEIIQAMLNATSNHVIQKPMSSQDSFRFQHLQNCLEAMESEVVYDNEDYGSEEVVQVDNLDHLLDYQSPTSSTTGGSTHFVDTQTLVNPSTTSTRLGGHVSSGNGTNTGNGSHGFGTMNELYSYNNDQQPPQQQQPSHNMGLYGVPVPSASFSQQQTYSGTSNLELMSNVATQGSGASILYPLTPGIVKAEPMVQQQYNHHAFPSTMGTIGLGMGMGMAQPLHTYQQPQGRQPMMHQYTRDMGQLQQLSHPTEATTHSTDGNNNGICSALGCNHAAKIKGMCKLHGGGRRCKIDGCMKSAQTGHLCIAHGGGKPCHVEGCPKTAQSRGLCKQHGGGVRCKFEGCTKSCQSGGFCRGHGGGKRCEFLNCSKWAQKNGLCAKHADADGSL